MTRTLLTVVLCGAITTGAPRGARAQEPYNIAAPVTNLSTLFTGLYGPNGLVLDSLATLPGEQPHSAHFNSDFQRNFSQFTTALVSQLVSLPLPSPAGGFTYEFDSSLGVFQRSTQSFGPILADRAETIGAHRFSIGFAFQRFSFDTVEGLDLGNVPAVFTHDNAQLLGGREDVVTTANAIQASVSQSTSFVTMGITDRFDVSLAVPLVATDLKVVSDANIHRLGTTNELTHFFRLSNGEVGDRRLFTAAGSASGLGDLMIRLKVGVLRSATNGVALGCDVRLPTGDELNLLGTGAPGFQAFAIWSGTYFGVSPHVNASYQWNGSSVLAGNPATGESASFPDQVGYAVGADVSANGRLTLAFDLVGRYVIDSERLQRQTFHALDGRSTFSSIGFARDSFNLLSGSAGLKINLLQRLLVDANLLFAVDSNGLRDKITPLVGVEYTF
jgi:hypothetical protein